MWVTNQKIIWWGGGELQITPRRPNRSCHQKAYKLLCSNQGWSRAMSGYPPYRFPQLTNQHFLALAMQPTDQWHPPLNVKGCLLMFVYLSAQSHWLPHSVTSWYLVWHWHWWPPAPSAVQCYFHCPFLYVLHGRLYHPPNPCFVYSFSQQFSLHTWPEIWVSHPSITRVLIWPPSSRDKGGKHVLNAKVVLFVNLMKDWRTKLLSNLV